MVKVKLKSVEGPGVFCPSCGSPWPVYDDRGRCSYCGYRRDARIPEAGYVEHLAARIVHRIMAEMVDPGKGRS